jgi:hypothetical protein
VALFGDRRAWLWLLLIGFGSSEAAAQQPNGLDGVEAVEGLCRRLDPSAALADVPPGDPVRRGWLKRRLEEQREAALADVYRITLQAEEFHFDDYDPETSLLPLNLTSGLSAFGGRVRLQLGGERVRLQLGSEDAHRLVDEHASQQVRLLVDFQLDAEEGAGKICAQEAEPARRQVRLLRIIPQYYQWVDRTGRVVVAAEGETDDPVQRQRIASLLQGAVVKVDTSLLPGPASGPSPAAADLQEWASVLLRPCLQQRIASIRRPVEGSLVLEVHHVAGGHIGQILLRQRLLEDAPLVDCVVGKLRRATLPASVPRDPQAQGRLTLPLFFQSQPLE